MGYYLCGGGTTLSSVTTAGTVTNLTLPTGVSLQSGKRLRGVVLNSQVILVNQPTENLMVDRFGTVRLLCPPTPASVIIMSNAASGTLTGTFAAKATFIIKDEAGNLISESPFSGSTTGAAITTDYIVASGIPVCPITIDGLSRRMYRTTTGPGATYFPWIDVDGNYVTVVQNDMSDASLQLVAAPTDLGQPPRFEFVAAWKDRLWGKTADDKDVLYYSGVNRPFACAPTQTVPIPPRNRDTRGITGFLPLKDALGIGRSDSLHQIDGTDETNFTRQTVKENVGIWATDSCQVIHNVGYFLGNPFGIYTWGGPEGGITRISDERVKAWFETDTYFNRAEFDNAVGSYDPALNMYVVNLATAGATALNRWIGYDITAGTWWGPHTTNEFTPTGAFYLRDADSIPFMAFGAADGKIYKFQSTKTDGSATAINFDILTNWMSGGTPNVRKTFLGPTIVSKIQSDGDLSIRARVGTLNAQEGATVLHDMTLGQETLPRLGEGQFCQLRFLEQTAGQDVIIYGAEVDFFEGRQKREGQTGG